LDKTLEKFATSISLVTPDIGTSNEVSPISILTPNADGSLSAGYEEIDAINLDDYENFDLMSWAINVDFGNTPSNWNMI
jgi:hypothetical protein